MTKRNELSPTLYKREEYTLVNLKENRFNYNNSKDHSNNCGNKSSPTG